MPSETAQLTKAALALPLKKRAALVTRLLRSLDEPTPQELDRQWLEEAAARNKACDEGKMEEIPWEVIKAETERKYKR